EAFRQAISRAAGLVADDPSRLVLFGVPPTFPAVGYGYIERGAALEGTDGAYGVASFREKPDRPTAQQYLKSGSFYWNCGIFVWRADAILAALEQFEPEIHASLIKLVDHIGTQGWQTALEKQFPQMKSISIDFAVLERADNLVVLEAPFAWDDVGSWQALERLAAADEQGNTVDGLHVGIDTSGCIIRSTDEHLIATIGLHDCLVVHTPDATLVAPKNDENALRELVNRLKEAGHDRFL